MKCRHKWLKIWQSINRNMIIVAEICECEKCGTIRVEHSNTADIGKER